MFQWNVFQMVNIGWDNSLVQSGIFFSLFFKFPVSVWWLIIYFQGTCFTRLQLYPVALLGPYLLLQTNFDPNMDQ